MYTLEANAHGHHDQFDDLEIVERSSSSGDETDCVGSPDGERKPRYKNIVHLWEFLLELLADESCRSVITWSRQMHGEFKLKKPEEIASRWGRLKHRPGMNYEKLSRALRHYYSKGVLRKVKGQRLVYKFHKLPYEYTPGKTRSLGTRIPTLNTIRRDKYNYKGSASPCSKTNLDGSEQPLLDKEKLRRFFEERLNIARNMKEQACTEQHRETPSPTASPERSSVKLPEARLRPVVPIPMRRPACSYGCDIRVVRPMIYHSPIILPIPAYKQPDSVIPYGRFNCEITSIPVSVIRRFRS